MAWGISWFEEIGMDVERDMDGISVIIGLQYEHRRNGIRLTTMVGWSGL